MGYLDWENLSFSWTFRRTEVLVVLEGDLNLSIEGTTFSAAHGDVFSILRARKWNSPLPGTCGAPRSR